MGATVNSSLTDGELPDGAGGDGGVKAVQIREDIEHTRSDISQTIHALQDKLNPTTLKEQAKETLQQAKEIAKHELSEGLSVAKEKVQHELHEAGHAVREATIGRVEHMVERAGRTMQETGGSFYGVVRSNPIPIALITIGSAWLFFSRRSASRADSRGTLGYYVDEYGQRHFYETYQRRPGQVRGTDAGSATGGAGRMAQGMSSTASQIGNHLSGTAGHVGQQVAGTASHLGQQVAGTASHLGQQVAGTASHLAGKLSDTAASLGQGVSGTATNVRHQVADTAGHVAHRVGEAASSLGMGASHLANRAGEGLGQVAHGARSGMVRAEQGLARAFADSPLAVGAAVLAIGTVVGLSLPSTRREDELLGDLRDRLRDNLSERAQELALGAIETAESKTTEQVKSFGGQPQAQQHVS